MQTYEVVLVLFMSYFTILQSNIVSNKVRFCRDEISKLIIEDRKTPESAIFDNSFAIASASMDVNANI